ncbi:MAG TPA: EMC3/TMCO1 family protein [Candidatus Paceibacterota bacterium]|nr:EMC3/TMCO1 family protein [Candidatus Paceibacterota bacterium]
MSGIGKGMKWMLVLLLFSMILTFAWDTLPIIKQTAHAILDPSVGKMLDINKEYGMIVLILIITLVTTILQKYGTDQVSLKKLKEEQKVLRDEMQKYKNDPAKMMELNKKSLEFIPKTYDLTIKPLFYTIIPMILLFRWFGDYFPKDYKLFGIIGWLWFYLIFSIIFTMILRKVMDVA